MDTVRLEDLTRRDVQRLLAVGAVNTAVIVLGATEQHGPHLPLGADTFIAEAVGEGLARGLGRALLAPPIRVGCSDEHMGFPGVISFRADTLSRVVSDYVASLARHGFANIVVVTTHGGNLPALAAMAESVRAAAMAGGGVATGNSGATVNGGNRGDDRTNVVLHTDLADALKGLRQELLAVSAARGVSPEASGAHAGESETSMLLALRPSLVHMDLAAPGYLGHPEGLTPEAFASGIEALDPEGVLGDPRGATAEHGRVYLRIVVDHLVRAIRGRLI